MTVKLPNGRQIVLLEGQAAQSRLTEERNNNYYQDITVKDMAIHLKQPVASFRSRADALFQFKNALREDVLPFQTEEARYLERLCLEVNRHIHALNPALIPPKVFIIKVKGMVFGRETVFTQNQCIVLPEALLTTKQKELLLPALYRSYYHLIAQTQPEVHRRIIGLLPFRPLPVPFNDLQNSQVLRPELLSTPETGLPKTYLHLEDSSSHSTIRLISVSHSQFHHFVVEDPTYALRSFILYPLDSLGPGSWSIRLSRAEGSTSPVSFRNLLDQIQNVKEKERISFLPGELAIADMFASLTQREAWTNELPPDKQAAFSEILDQVEAILTGPPFNEKSPS